MLETLALDRWTGPYDAALKARAVSALEQGAVLFFPNLAFALPEAEKPFLDASVSGGQATGLVQDLLPYRNVERARTSFRPVQVKDRHYSKISDDRLLHIDAFPSRPMQGRRILRFFANVAPTSARRWQVGQPFEDFAKTFLPRIGPPLPGESWLYDRL